MASYTFGSIRLEQRYAGLKQNMNIPDLASLIRATLANPNSGHQAPGTRRPKSAKWRCHKVILPVAMCFPVAHAKAKQLLLLPPDTCDNSSSLSSVLTKPGAPLSGSLFGWVGLNSRF
jgi:hypothetical protein